MYKQYRIGAVILAYNVERTIENTIKGVPALVDMVYVVDDGSRDNTASIVEPLSNPNLSLIRHDRNRGPGAALITGFSTALEDGMDIVIKIDGDGQMPMDQIENLIKPIADGKVEYTKGDRLSKPENRIGMPRFRLFGNILLTVLTRVASGYRHVNDTQNGYVAISSRALKNIGIRNVDSYYGYLNDILVRLNSSGFEIQDIPMPAIYGSEESSIKLRRYVFKVSLLLLTRFMWRLKVKYFRPLKREASIFPT